MKKNGNRAGRPAGEPARLRRALEEAREGVVEVQRLMDGVLTAVVLAHGGEVQAPESPGGAGGKRLTLPRFSLEEMGRAYTLRARRDGAGEGYILEVLPRGTEGGERGGE